MPAQPRGRHFFRPILEWLRTDIDFAGVDRGERIGDGRVEFDRLDGAGDSDVDQVGFLVEVIHFIGAEIIVVVDEVFEIFAENDLIELEAFRFVGRGGDDAGRGLLDQCLLDHRDEWSGCRLCNA